MSTFQPPPTWALPIVVDKTTKEAYFSPIWLKWFVDLTKALGAGGGYAGGTTLQVLHGDGPNWGSVVEADLSLANVSTNNATTARHGFMRILPNVATQYLDGQGNFTTPAGLVFAGESGEDGYDGAPGQRGVTGAVGVAGPVVFLEAEPGDEGPIGIQGLKGTTGAQGPQGPAVFLEAEAGEEGPIGIRGLQGTTGGQGPQGPAIYFEGESGEEGPIGIRGATGTTGSQGPLGPAIFLEGELVSIVDDVMTVPYIRTNNFITQAFTAQTTVTVTHNFRAYPIVTVMEGTSELIPLTITHGSLSAFTVTFSVSTTGSIIAVVGNL